jgi:ankyrin repeat protein
MATQNNYESFDEIEPGEELGLSGNRLHYACALGDVAEVKKLLKLDAYDPNKPDFRGLNALGLAAFHGRASCVEALLADSRVNPDLLDPLGRTPFIIAAEKGNLKCVIALREASVLEHESHGLAANALQAAATEGHTDVVEYLCNYIDPRARNSEGDTALIRAAESGSLACVRALMPLCDVRSLDDNGCNLLMRAAKKGHLNIVMELLPLFALEAKDRNGNDALALAEEKLQQGANEFPELIEATIKFLAAYKHAMREMTLLSAATSNHASNAPKTGRSSRI